MISARSVKNPVRDARRKASAFALLFIGAAMPILSVFVRWSNSGLADVILVGSFAVIAAAVTIAITGGTK